MSGILHDLRLGIHALVRHRRTTLVSIVILAVCIGANTAIFSLLARITLRPFPGVERQDRLVAIGAWDGNKDRCCGLSVPDLQDLRLRSRSFDGILAARLIGVNVGTIDRPSTAGGQIVTANFFDVARVRPMLGRTFAAGEDRAGAAPVAVISERLWRDRYASDREIVGRTQLLNGRPFTIIGVVPDSFRGLFIGYWIDVWVPLSSSHRFLSRGGSLDDRGELWLNGYARLKDGVTAAESDAEVRSLFLQLTREQPSTNVQRQGAAFPLSRSPYGATPMLAPALVVLMIVVTLVLFIGCANIAGLQLVRALARLRDLAIRAALGASAPRLFRQLLVENLLLAAVGGLTGLAMAYPLQNVVTMMIPPRRVQVDLSGEIDLRALLVTAGLSLLAGILCGLVPAMQAWKLELADVLKEESAGASAGRTRLRIRETLVVAQVCLCVVLCVTAGLFVRQAKAMQRLDPGFRDQGLLFASYDLFGSGYDSAQGGMLLPEILRRVRALPGVTSATLASRIPLSLGEPEHSEIRIDGHVVAPGQKPGTSFTIAGPDYFRTMETRLLAGRDFDDRDTAGAALVCAINETLRRRYFARAEPIGARLFLAGRWRTIVAVVGDGKYQRLAEPSRTHAFLPLLQEYRGSGTIVVRSDASAGALASPMRRAVSDVVPRLTPFLTTVEDHLRTATFPETIAALFIGVLGAVALFLATIGVYAVISHGVLRRGRELVIRRVLGATAADVRRLVVGHGARMAALGLILGILAALGCSIALRDRLSAIATFDVVAYAVAVPLIGLAAMLASWIPSLRAGRVEPADALRSPVR